MPSVAIDVTPLLGRRTGIGVAVAGFVEHLARRAGPAGLDLVGYGLTARGRGQLPGHLPDGVRPANRPAPAGILLRLWGRGAWPPAEWWTGTVDLVHGTNFVAPPTRRAQTLVTVWDLTALHHPELCTPTSRRYPDLVARALKRGAWVHTASRHVAEEVSAHFAVPEDRIRVVAPGVQPAGSRPSPPPRPGRRPYVLALGRTEPRKDLPALIRGFSIVAGRHPDLELRIAGPAGWAEDDVVAAAAASPVSERIHREGWVEDPAGLLARAAVFAYPSVYEGFGLPPLEAMAAGVPVVATAVGSLPEVLGGAAEMVAAGDDEAMAAALDRVLTDATRREELVQAGQVRAASFTWEAAADGLTGVYRELAGGTG